MRELLIKFVEWTKLKIRLHIRDDQDIYFYEREIWWVSLGINIGFEQDGKHNNFERPVLVLKKFGAKTLWILPMTSKEKVGIFYYHIEYQGKNYFLILSQLKLISSKRLLRKIRTLSEDEFEDIKLKLKALI
jgi:mRNA-degrading endonuclease toxin of MazEF toxin-antitoxin module